MVSFRFPHSNKPWLGAALAALILAASFVPSRASAQQIIHVPGDKADLQQAINAVPEGGVIEMAAGTYTAPSTSFTIFGGAKGFTIRAAAGANVILSGGGHNDIIRFTSSDHPVTFQNLTFANGLSTTNAIGGAMTLVNVRAVFDHCTFDTNAANGPTGGGALWIDANTYVSIDACQFQNNTSQKFGGAMSIGRDSRVYVRGSSFVGNRVDISGPAHIPNSDGGALHISNSYVQVDNCRFDGNVAGYTGGAIFALGDYDHATPTDVIVNNSSFTNNSAFQTRTSAFDTPSVGGAIHVEAQTTAKIFASRFTSNTSPQGGAISLYQSIMDVRSCTFKSNVATGSGADESQGGTIIALSADNPGSTVNRRPIQLTVRDSYFEGKAGGPSARQGGFVFAAGDLNFAYGLGGLPQNGTPASNRGSVNIAGCVFNTATVNAANGTAGTGGAMEGAFVDVTMDNCIVENCGAQNTGGAVRFIQNSVAKVTNTTITHCTAGDNGAAIWMAGGSLNVTGSNLVKNQGGPAGARGSTLTTVPANPDIGLPAFDMEGLISSCIISNDNGSSSIYDGDRGAAPYNRLQYSANTIFPDGLQMYFSDISGPQDVAGLNGVTVNRADGTVTVKAPTPNVSAASAPNTGAILFVPPAIPSSGAPGETLPILSYLAFASNGAAPSLDGQPQSADAGVVQNGAAGVHSLTVGATTFATNPPPASSALNISTRLAVGTSDKVLIGGFIVQGAQPKRVIIRGKGPSLNVNGVPVPGSLQDPALELHDKTLATIATNNNWRATQIGGVITSDQAIDIQGTGLAPTNDAESAIVAVLDPGSYTAILQGVGGTTGVGLVEVYDLDPAPGGSALANISTRGLVQTGDNVMIGGFIVGNGGSTKILIRGKGPSLGAAGVSGTLADPALDLFDANGTKIATDNDWKDTQAAEIQATGLAPASDLEAAILVPALPPGSYTAIVRGNDGGTGVGLVEVYVLQ